MGDSNRRRDLLESPADGPTDTVFAEMDGELAQYVTVEDPLHRFEVPTTAADVPTDVLALAEEHVSEPADGFFGPESMMWEISRENVILLGSISTILLQIAHPLVAQGIEDHGSLHRDYVTRFRRTFDIFDTVMFGDVVSAVRASIIVRTLHERVRGELQSDAGRFEAGESYYANDPDLLMWVAATLVEMPIVATETYVGSLSEAEREQFYQEMKVFNRLMGVPADRLPETYEDFSEYFERTLTEDVALNDSGATVVDGFIEQFAPARPVAEFLAGTLLPPPARDALGIDWSAGRQFAFERFAAAVRSIPLDAVPDRLRYRKRYRLFGRHL